LAEHNRSRHSGPQAYPLVLDRCPVRGLEPELERIIQVEEQRFLAAVGEAEAQIDELLPVGRRNLTLRITDYLEVHIRHASCVRHYLLGILDDDLRWVTLGTRRTLLDWFHALISVDPLQSANFRLEVPRALAPLRRLQEQTQ